MITRLLWKAMCLLVVLLITATSRLCWADVEAGTPATEKGVTFSHVYKIDMQPGSSVQTGSESSPTTAGGTGENEVVFRHNIRLRTPACDCGESETFKALMYRVNGLEEEVNYLKTQCADGCCNSKGAGVDTSCGGHGTYQPVACTCVCDPGWQGPDCSASACDPDDCNDNGRCVDGRCVCHQGYAGPGCGQLACPDNCNDKGRCVDGKCVCFPHYGGEHCGVQRCPNDCVGNGRCEDGRCVCSPGFHGDDCSLVMGPKGLQLVKATDVSLLVQWQPVQGAEYYMLTHHPKNQEKALQEVRVANTESSYLISGLVPGVTYTVEVYAAINRLQSEADSIEATTDVSAIDDIRVTGQSEDSISVEWQNPAAVVVDHFRLTATDPRGVQGQHSVQQSQEARTKHTLNGLQPGTQYRISVQAIVGATEGKASSTTGVTDLDAPANLVTTGVTEDTALVTWDRVQSEVSGYVLTHTSSEGPGREVPLGPESDTHRLRGLRPGVRYTVYVWAVNGDRVSGRSSTDAETDLDAPTNLLARDESESAFSVVWDRSQAPVDGYVLTYSSSSSSSAPGGEIPVGPDTTTYRLTELGPGAGYTVSVWAVKGDRVSRKTSTQAETVGHHYALPLDCVQVMRNGNSQSGVYTVYLQANRSRATEVFCDMDTDGGGWLMLQRRTVGKLDFMKRWRQYIAGFGNLTDEFWLGMDSIYELTSGPTQYEVRFDLGFGSERAYAVYDSFKIAPAKQKFKLSIGTYSGTAGDAMTYHQGRPWSTVDSDNDIALGNCALTHRGAWWYKNCHLANLNGRWGDNRHSMGVNWEPWKGHLMSLDFTEMKIRPLGGSSDRARRSLTATETKRQLHQQLV
uniref:Tenascin N n=1 Tax=Gadus morhua TaxID=8049 RepID=A0A8C5C9T1_GADMO